MSSDDPSTYFNSRFFCMYRHKSATNKIIIFFVLLTIIIIRLLVDMGEMK